MFFNIIYFLFRQRMANKKERFIMKELLDYISIVINIKQKKVLASCPQI